MMDLEEAKTMVARYAAEAGAVELSDSVVDRGTYWFFPVGYIGSSGVIVDKNSGRLYVMGSALSDEEMFWGHEHGFSPTRAVLRVHSVSNMMRAVDFLALVLASGPPRSRNPFPRREWVAEKLGVLPCDFEPQSYWLKIRRFRKMLECDKWFTFSLIERMVS